MPYKRVGKCVYKEKPDGSLGKKEGCSKTEAGAKAYMRAKYAHENMNKSFSELSMAITKMSHDVETGAMHLSLVNSDTGEDSFGEKMSLELFNDFVSRIEGNTPVPEPFDRAVCEDGWCGGMPYLSISHYKSDIGLPGTVEKVYVDGEKLKSRVTLDDNPLGKAVWKSIYDDKYGKLKDFENPVRVSIGFLDLEHKHEIDGKEDYLFTRTKLGQVCPKCAEGVGGKVYLKGQLVHKAFTRVPANTRTSVEVEEMATKSGIITRKGDAESIIGEELVEELELRSEAAEEGLVIKAEKDLEQYAWSVRNAFDKEFGPPPQPSLWVRSVTDNHLLVTESQMDGDMYSSKLYKVGYAEKDGKFTFDKRKSWQEMELALVPKKSEADEENLDEWEIEFEDNIEEESELTEEAKREDVSPADRKRATKEYGNVTYADPTNKKYPIDTAEHIRAAWNYIHQAKNAAKYPDKGAAIKKRIIAAWKRVIDKKGPPSAASNKSEAIMAEQDVENTVEEEVLDEEEITQPVASEKSGVEGAVEKFLAAYATVKKGNLTGDEAAKVLQPVMNELAETTKKDIADPMAGVADVVKSAIAEVMATLKPELVAEVLKAMPTGIAQNRAETPKPRSLQLFMERANVPEQGQENLTQIQKIARASTIGVANQEPQ